MLLDLLHVEGLEGTHGALPFDSRGVLGCSVGVGVFVVASSEMQRKGILVHLYLCNIYIKHFITEPSSHLRSIIIS